LAKREIVGAERGELEQIKKLLDEGKPADRTISDLNLLTAKRRIFLLNGAESDVTENLKTKIAEFGGAGDYLVADLSSVGAEDAAVANLIKKAYEVLGLISFFTTGEDETRAWTIEGGALAPQAAGVIHTDFEKKFIRLEVVAGNKLLEAGGWTGAKHKGWLRVEGKEYEVKDGDVVEVRHG
jgi:ribosome-binding ATPase YchF (GTP1/OBG family)